MPTFFCCCFPFLGERRGIDRGGETSGYYTKPQQIIQSPKAIYKYIEYYTCAKNKFKSVNSTLDRFLFDVNPGPNPTPMSKSDKLQIKNKIETGPRLGIRGGGKITFVFDIFWPHDIVVNYTGGGGRPPRGLGWEEGGWGEGAIDWGRDTPKRLYKAPVDYTKSRQTIQSPDRQYKAPEKYTKVPKHYTKP